MRISEIITETATAGGTSTSDVQIGVVTKNKSPRTQKPTDNALDNDNVSLFGTPMEEDNISSPIIKRR